MEFYFGQSIGIYTRPRCNKLLIQTYNIWRIDHHSITLRSKQGEVYDWETPWHCTQYVYGNTQKHIPMIVNITQIEHVVPGTDTL